MTPSQKRIDTALTWIGEHMMLLGVGVLLAAAYGGMLFLVMFGARWFS